MDAERTFEALFREARELDDSDRLGRVVVPGLLEYFLDPTAANARALLAALAIPAPYAQLRALADAFAAAPPPPPSAPRAGGAPPPAPGPEFFELHRRLDLLHDLLGERIYDDVAERIFRGAPPLPDGVRARVAEAIAQNNATFRDPDRRNPANAALVAIAEDAAGLARAAFELPDLAADAHLASLVQSWTSRSDLEIVLDGLFAARIPPMSELRTEAQQLGSLNRAKIARSLCVCAILQLMLCDAPQPAATPAARATPPLRRVAFLIGDFQTLDNPGADAFAERWARRIRTDAPALSHLAPDQIATRRVRPGDLPSLAATPYAGVALGRAGLTVGGRFVPYRPPRGAAAAPNARAQGLSAPLCTSYKKDWLGEVFADYLGLSPAAREAPEVREVLDAIPIVNGFRDAIRAEVALARGAVYVTVDALALVYYEARRAALGAAPGDGWLIRPSGPENLAIRCYAPAAAGASRKRRRRRARRRPRRKAATPPDAYEDYEDDESEEITDPAVLASVTEYYAKPSIANALALLRAMGMARPYASLAGDGEGPEEDAPPPDEHAGI